MFLLYVLGKLIETQYHETSKESFMMISPDQLASATNGARLKGMNCNKMSTPPSVLI